MTTRRTALLGAAALATWRPAQTQTLAQTTTLDLPPARLETKLDDTVAPGYRRDVMVRWGERVGYDAPPWNPRAPSVEAAEAQFGWDGRICALVMPPRAEDRVPRAVLAIAHPTVEAAMAFPGGRDQPAIAGAMQGASLLNLQFQAGRWIVVDGGFQTRRLTAGTLCRIGGPLAASLGGAVRGLLALQGGCATPWGSLLLTEGDPAPWLARLRGLDARFADGSRFGMVAELDPLDPQAVPVKRSALGRFAHGDAAAVLARDGRAVIYLSERRGEGCLFRFTSAGPAGEPDALDAGMLHAARIDGEALRWLQLPDDAAANPAAAAQRLGATQLDQPSGLALDPADGTLHVACRGNPQRPNGYVFSVTPQNGDAGAETAAARLLFIAGPPGAGGRFGAAGPQSLGTFPEQPDTLLADTRGHLWIGTNRGGQVGAAPDALFGCDTAGPGRGIPLPLYGAPRAAAVGGAALTPDGGTLFAMVRHPGAEPGATFDRPGTRWPQFEPATPPRSTLIALVPLRGGPVGG